MHGTRILEETDRLMTVCNSCRYCEGLCAVFPAMEMRRAFSDGDLDYLANLCHGCGGLFRALGLASCAVRPVRAQRRRHLCDCGRERRGLHLRLRRGERPRG